MKRVLVPDKQTLNTLRAEVDAMRKLSGNPHIVSYIDSHASRFSNGTGYEVLVLMEYCSNNGLIDFMNARLVNRLTEPEILRITSEISEGVANMHALDPPLVHRDIKIENVLIDGDGVYKLCDFGSASGVLRPPNNAEEFQILQDDIMKHTTAQYRSPEMLDLYRRFPIDEKSDIWALGIFLYKLCYYTTPFEKNSINGSANGPGAEAAILKSQFGFPSSPVYSERLKNVISKCLALDPRNRPNIYQLLEELFRMRGLRVPIDDFHKSKKEVKPKLPLRPIERSMIDEINLPADKTSKPSNVLDRTKLSAKILDSVTQFDADSRAATPGNDISHHYSRKKVPSNTADTFAVPRSRSSGRERPKSMYEQPEHLYSSSNRSLENMKHIRTGLNTQETVELEPNPENYIGSNMDFLRSLSKQDSGINRRQREQSTGDSLKSLSKNLRKLSTGQGYAKKNSVSHVGNLKIEDSQKKKSSTLPSKHEQPPTLKRNNSIQARVSQLLNKKPEKPSHRPMSLVEKPKSKSKSKSMPEKRAVHKDELETHNQDRPQRPKSMVVKAQPSVGEQHSIERAKLKEIASKKTPKKPPQKPVKPKHLRANESRITEEYEVLSDVSSTDFEEWEKAFNEKYPCAV